MMVNKITEVTIFESPDGGRTVFARKPGQSVHERKLHWEDPKLIKERQELESQRRWVEIHNARGNNPALDKLCEQVEMLYELGKQEK
jgi:hypothetical protein